MQCPFLVDRAAAPAAAGSGTEFVSARIGAAALPPSIASSS